MNQTVVALLLDWCIMELINLLQTLRILTETVDDDDDNHFDDHADSNHVVYGLAGRGHRGLVSGVVERLLPFPTLGPTTLLWPQMWDLSVLTALPYLFSFS